nr:hypothetical protein [Acinetobacter seifertii]
MQQKFSLEIILEWMLLNLEKDGCLYQEDVVNFLVKNHQMDFLKENADGNLVLKLSVNSSFKKRQKIMLFG